MTLAPASIRAALSSFTPPEVRWVHGDDLCDCTFQILGDWANPYIGKTLRVRFCCIWAEIYKEYPEVVEEIDAYYDENTDAYIPAPMEWDADDCDMPRALWYRQIATKTGKSLPEVREEYRDQEPPKRLPGGTGRPLMEEVNSGHQPGVHPAKARRGVRAPTPPGSITFPIRNGRER